MNKNVKLKKGDLIKFHHAAYNFITAEVNKLNNEIVTLFHVVYEDGKEYDKEMTLSLSSMLNIEVIRSK